MVSLCLQKEEVLDEQQYKDSQLSMISVKGFLKMMVQNVWEKIAEKLDFVENSNFARKSSMEESRYNNAAGLQPVTLLR